MFGYATTATPELMPAPIVFAHHLLEELTRLRKEKVIEYLRPDSKAQVSVLHDNGKATEITAVVISHQTRDVPLKRIQKDLKAVAHEVLDKTGLLTKRTEYFINPTGRFVIGGPCGDSGRHWAERLSWIRMAAWDHMAVVLFPARTPRRWIVRLPIMAVMPPRISLLRGLLINVRSRSPMRLVSQNLSASTSALMARERLMTIRSPGFLRMVRFSISVQP